MEKAEEVLNIDHHTRILVEKALIRCNSLEHAAVLLGVSTRTLYRYRKRFGIWRDPLTGEVYFPKNSIRYEHLVR